MHILISNDDGVWAPGLLTLVHALRDIAKVTVFAPDRNRSGASNSLTLDMPVRLQRLENGFFSVQGTPTDCVHLALTGVLEDEPDMVISGINAGANLGDDVLYSGTVAAAMEGRYLGLPALAISLASNEGHYYETAANVAKKLVLRLLEDPLPAQTILNINVPDIPFADLTGYEVTRLGTRHRAAPTIKSQDPRGEWLYWVGPAGPEQDAGLGTDFFAVSTKKVSITPLQLDLTHYKSFNQISTWINEFSNLRTVDHS